MIGNGAARRSAHGRVAGAALAVAIVVVTGCSSNGSPAPGRKVAAFVGHRWLITHVRHGGVDLAIPRALGAWVEFKSDGTFDAADGVNSYGASFAEVGGGFRLVGDVTASTVGVPGPGGAPASTLAAIAAISQILQDHPQVGARVQSEQLTMSASDYQVTGAQDPP